ncbi:hypothetical protein M9Y10_033750 [Tritrichomonas musculus]|uniref:AMP-dependent synthetase/ligase domain-containing protein n=1 Tax=Tritrichomonas musculus TaxID=1915356 RepID=A0ABR2KDT1_9EUKA
METNELGKPHSVIVSDSGNPKESPIFQHNTTIKENGGKLISTFRCLPDAYTASELLKAAVVKYGDCNFVGERRIDKKTGKLSREYYWLTYKEFTNRVKRFAIGLISNLGLKPGDKVGIYSINCPWWQTVAYACFMSSLVPVPIYDTLGPGAAEYIICHSECSLVVVSQEKFDSLKTVLYSLSQPDPTERKYTNHIVKNVLVIGDIEPTSIESNNTTIKVQSCESALVSEDQIDSFNKCCTEPGPDDLAMIMYTSGTTGLPKGCLLTHRNIIAGATGLGCLGCSISTSDTYYSFLPLAHIYALGVEIIMVARGASIGYYSGTVKNMLDDLSILQPTIICGVPRVWNRIVDSMKDKIKKLPSFLQTVINAAMKWKLKRFREEKPYSIVMDSILFRPFLAALGGRVRLIVSGGAPILPDVYDFLATAITPNIVSGYGLTEVSASVSVSEIITSSASDIGAVSLTSQVKLRYVDGFNYDPRGSPMCGEVLVKGPHVFKGYYKDEALTKEVLDDDGWFATGDIGTIASNGSLQIIDRVKQLIKLSQGEYISLSSLTDIYNNTAGIQNIFIYADSHQDSPLAVVIPEKKLIENWNNQGITDIINSKVVKDDILQKLLQTAIKNNLRGFEKIKHVLIDVEEFTVENGLLTPSMKPQWQSLRKKYEAALLALKNEDKV